MVGVGRPRVFVIDDEKPLGRVIWRGMSDAYDVVYESNPEAALERLCRDDERFDVIFLDIIMPELNGILLFDELALRAPARRDRVVFITGGAGIPAVADFIEKHHYIEKPFRLEELEATADVYAASPLSRGPR
jgi:DNA-binding NtrC family response regulator